MRKIRVRAWHNLKKEYCQVHRFLVLGEDGTLINDDCIIEQDTGLKDKNGVEIYEGDILKVANGSINGTIMFQTYAVKYAMVDGFNNTLPLFCWTKDGIYDGRWSHYCEVIGNIHQNKELLCK